MHVPCMYQVCKFTHGGRRIKVIASGLAIGEAADTRRAHHGSWIRHVRYPHTGVQ